MAPGRARRAGALRSFAVLAAILVAYFAVPVDAGAGRARIAANLALTAVGVGVIAAVVFGEFARAARGARRRLGGVHLLALFEIVTAVFALSYYSLAVHGHEQMAGIATKLDALYFTATTMTTVGFGDIHPVGQVAKAVVTGQIFFDLLFIGAFARLLTSAGSTDPGGGPAGGTTT